MADIRVPKLNNQDDEYILSEWLVGDGEPVEPDDALATIETSKADADVICAEAGVLRHAIAAGASCAPGSMIGQVFEPGSPGLAETPRVARPDAADRGDDDGLIITAPARALMERSGVGLDVVRRLGVKVVRQADIERLADGGEASSIQELSAAQRAVAKTVIRSHATIPAAYTVVKVDVGAAQVEARRQARLVRKLLGLPELLVAVISSLHSAFPLFFASPMDEYTAQLSDEPNVGVTIDVGKGLYVPVVKNAAQLRLAEIAEVLTGFRLTAASGTFRADALTGGNMTITLHNEADIVLAIPIIQPGQTCALALAGTQREADAEAGTRAVANIGLAYDHRFINGRDAIIFLQAVKKALESPAILTKEPDAEIELNGSARD